MTGGHAERIARLEERVDNSEDTVDDLKVALNDLTTQISKLNEALTKMRGFTGGVMFTFSLLGTGVGFLLTTLYQLFKHNGG